MDLIMGVCLGIGLSTACGLRVFVPLLVMSIASLSGHLSLSPEFDWIGTYPALVAFAIAAVIEILLYLVPFFDNLLDTIATPAAIIAGIIATASCVSEVSPFLQWSLAIIAGGGSAGALQGITALTRGASTATTGGLGNPVVSTAEMGGAILLSILAIVFPVLVCLVVIVFLFFVGKKVFKKFRKTGHATAIS